MLAEATRGAVINSDSAQLYADIPILSAAPTADELTTADHRLYGVRDGATPCSAAEWAAMAKAEIDALHTEGRLPILVGGTGLYLRTLLDGIAPVPEIDPEIRANVRAASVSENYAALVVLDPVTANRLNPGDTTRIARALEVVRSTGKSLSHWQQHLEGGIGSSIDLKPLVLMPPRDWLFERCDRRFSLMIDQGAIEEVRTLLNRNLNPQLPVMRAIGVPELVDHLNNKSTLDQAIGAGQMATRRYAKRQFTWFSNQPPDNWPRFDGRLEDGAVGEALALAGLGL